MSKPEIAETKDIGDVRDSNEISTECAPTNCAKQSDLEDKVEAEAETKDTPKSNAALEKCIDATEAGRSKSEGESNEARRVHKRAKNLKRKKSAALLLCPSDEEYTSSNSDIEFSLRPYNSSVRPTASAKKLKQMNSLVKLSF